MHLNQQSLESLLRSTPNPAPTAAVPVRLYEYEYMYDSYEYVRR
jgi:hypothetical protein